MTTVMLGEMRKIGAVERVSAIDLNGTAPKAAELRNMLRTVNGGIFLDRDGVMTIIDRQIEMALKLAFTEHEDPSRGIKYSFDRQLVHKLFGISPRYNDGATPIQALMALNLEAAQTGRNPNELLRETIQSVDAVKMLDALIAKHTAHEETFIMKEMYWWRDGGFFHSEESSHFIDAYKGPHGVSSRDAVVSLHEAGYPLAMITNAPNRGLRDAGFKKKDRKNRISGKKTGPEEGKLVVLTRKQLGEDGMKPNPNGLYEAAKHLGVSIEHSIVVGDTISDMLFARNGGATPVLVESGMGSAHHIRAEFPGIAVFPDLPTLARGLLRE